MTNKKLLAEKKGLPRINALATRTRSIQEQASYVRGQSLFEVVVAIAVSAVIIVTFVSLVTNSIRNATFSRNNTQASKYAQEATEWLRGQRDGNISTFATNALIPNWCLRALAWTQSSPCGANDFIPNTTFIRQVTFVSSTMGVPPKLVIESRVRVHWTDSQGYHEVLSTTQFTDWRQR